MFLCKHPPTTETYTLSLHDALPISGALNPDYNPRFRTIATNFQAWPGLYTVTDTAPTQVAATVLAPGSTTVNPTMCDLGSSIDRKSTRLNSSHSSISYAVFCLKKKK